VKGFQAEFGKRNRKKFYAFLAVVNGMESKEF
jgi:hypothetical protein